MGLIDISRHIGGIADLLASWHRRLAELETHKRVRLARYCEKIADSLARAGEATLLLGEHAGAPTAQRQLVRELGRLQGYGEDVTVVLEGQLDGRRLAGLKRRLERLAVRGRFTRSEFVDLSRVDTCRMLEAEGYVRSLADRLRVER